MVWILSWRHDTHVYGWGQHILEDLDYFNHHKLTMFHRFIQKTHNLMQNYIIVIKWI
jgi:hypothetical protein